jgi:hypothetical protein
MLKVVVEVEGGVVQDVNVYDGDIEQEIELELIDKDILEEEEDEE